MLKACRFRMKGEFRLMFDKPNSLRRRSHRSVLASQNFLPAPRTKKPGSSAPREVKRTAEEDLGPRCFAKVRGFRVGSRPPGEFVLFSRREIGSLAVCPVSILRTRSRGALPRSQTKAVRVPSGLAGPEGISRPPRRSVVRFPDALSSRSRG